VTLLFPLVGLLLAFVPIKGRSLGKWVPGLWTFGLRGARGQLTWQSRSPFKGHLMIMSPTSEMEPAEDKPPSLKGLKMLMANLIDVPGTKWGVMRDYYAQTFSITMRAWGHDFALLDPDEQAQRIQAWAMVIASYARQSPVEFVQWLERIVPDEDEGVIRYMRERFAHPTGHRHEVLITLTISERGWHRQMKRAGQGNLERGACVMLAQEASHLKNLLEGAGVTCSPVLSPRAYAAEIRAAYDPGLRARRAAIERAGGRPDVHPANAWPRRLREHFDSLESDGWWSRTYWVAEWPRVEVGPNFLSPLLLRSTCLRSIACIMEPLTSREAVADHRRALMAVEQDRKDRARTGFTDMPHHEAEEDLVVQLGRELADGHVSVRFSGYVTVTAHDAEELDQACQEVEQLASQSHLELERLIGAQEVAHTYTLPIGRGRR
jgi:hypothetical protein